MILYTHRLNNVTLDTGIYISGSQNNIAYGVELCDCVDKYNGTSCQNPANGHYRWKSPDVIGMEKTLDDFVGESYPCNCNGRSETCDPDTGHCKVTICAKDLYNFFLY